MRQVNTRYNDGSSQLAPARPPRVNAVGSGRLYDLAHWAFIVFQSLSTALYLATAIIILYAFATHGHAASRAVHNLHEISTILAHSTRAAAERGLSESDAAVLRNVTLSFAEIAHQFADTNTTASAGRIVAALAGSVSAESAAQMGRAATRLVQGAANLTTDGNTASHVEGTARSIRGTVEAARDMLAQNGTGIAAVLAPSVKPIADAARAVHAVLGHAAVGRVLDVLADPLDVLRDKGGTDMLAANAVEASAHATRILGKLADGDELDALRDTYAIGAAVARNTERLATVLEKLYAVLDKK